MEIRWKATLLKVIKKKSIIYKILKNVTNNKKETYRDFLRRHRLSLNIL